MRWYLYLGVHNTIRMKTRAKSSPLYFYEKVHFDHLTLAKVWFCPWNFKTGYLWPSNYQNRSNLTTGLF
jgi:hypothetical protein